MPGRQPGRGVDSGRGGGGDPRLQPGTLDILAVDEYTLPRIVSFFLYLLYPERLVTSLNILAAIVAVASPKCNVISADEWMVGGLLCYLVISRDFISQQIRDTALNFINE